MNSDINFFKQSKKTKLAKSLEYKNALIFMPLHFHEFSCRAKSETKIPREDERRSTTNWTDPRRVLWTKGERCRL